MLGKIWDFVVDSAVVFFVPLVCSYFACTSNAFLNVSCKESVYLEKLGNTLLAPCHYLFVGQEAEKNGKGDWVFADRFNYQSNFVPKTIVSILAAVPSFGAGVCVKALALLTPGGWAHQKELTSAIQATWTESNLAKYVAYGINVETPHDWLQSQGHVRRPGDEKNLQQEKEAMKTIAALFEKAHIPWWVDCGTLLGTFRYGGVIPWDEDIDIAVLIDDFDNVKRVLNQLDPKDFFVHDWSTREHPKSSIKVYSKKSGTYIDIYHFKIHPEARQIQYVLALENGFFFPEWWKIRERRFTSPVAFDTVFPLKKAYFDGLVVNVPQDTEKYLQRYYGENLAPAKVFDPVTNQYEKDLTHPYWQRAYVH
jgi:hypothetical protein